MNHLNGKNISESTIIDAVWQRMRLTGCPIGYAMDEDHQDESDWHMTVDGERIISITDPNFAMEVMGAIKAFIEVDGVKAALTRKHGNPNLVPRLEELAPADVAILTRQEMIAVLVKDDPNGVYSDEDCIGQGWPCITKEEAHTTINRFATSCHC